MSGVRAAASAEATMGKRSSFLTRVTTDDFANATSTEEESIAFAIAALQSMPETAWRNRVNHQPSNNNSSSSSSKRPRSATQAAMKTKCPTRTLLPSVSPKLPHQQSAGTNQKNAKQQQHCMWQSRPQPLQQSTVKTGTHNQSARNHVAPMEAVVVAQRSERDVPAPPGVAAPFDAPSDTVVPPWSLTQSPQPTFPLPLQYEEEEEEEQLQQPLSSAPPHCVRLEEPQQQQQQQAEEDSTEEDDSPTTSTTTRLARCRERNREHARKTRLRKKVALQELQTRIAQLQQTKASLQQRVQEQSIASILLEFTSTTTTTTMDPAAGTEDPSAGDSTRNNDDNNKNSATLKAAGEEQLRNSTDTTITNGMNKRQRSHIVPHSPLQVRIAGKGMVTIQSQINWKTGTYMDDAGVTQQLNSEELELLRYVHCMIECNEQCLSMYVLLLI